MEIDVLKNDLINTIMHLSEWMKPDHVSKYNFTRSIVKGFSTETIYLYLFSS